MPKYRMFHVDHYMAKPIPMLDDQLSDVNGKPVYKVPVIRIFGTDSKGRKICLHVHGFYPYIAIQTEEKHSPELAKKVVLEIQAALGQMVDQNKQNKQQVAAGQQSNRTDEPRPYPNTSNAQDQELYGRIRQERRKLNYLSNDQRFPIHRIESYKSFNYYGYHKDPEDFYKLHLYNPRMVKQLFTICEEGLIFGRFIPCFWAHLPYILLFFIDNNLRGMQFIEVDRIEWRRNRCPSDNSFATTPTSEGIDSEKQPGGAPRGSQFGPEVAVDDDEFSDSSDDNENLGIFTSKQNPLSTCEMEGDIRFEWILNRQKMGNKGNDDALRELWLDDQEASQTSSNLWESKLPLFSVELGYLQQLFDTFGIEETQLNLQLTERFPKLEPTDNNSAGMVQNRVMGDEDVESDRDSWEEDDEFLHEALKSRQMQDLNQSVESSVSHNNNTNNNDPRIVDNKQETVPTSAKKITCSDNSMIDGRSAIGSTSKDHNHFPATSRSSREGSAQRETINHEYQFLSIISMELHCSTRDQLKPDPRFDPIEAVFYCIRNDVPDTSEKAGQLLGLIISDPLGGRDLVTADRSRQSINPKSPGSRSNLSMAQRIRTLLNRTGLTPKDIELTVVDTEIELIMALVEIVKTHDPEILLGYEVELLSWGYVLERASNLDMSIGTPLSRISEGKIDSSSDKVEPLFVQPIVFTGRMVFSVWRIVRHDINLTTWSYERLHKHCLGERIPCFEFETLTQWYNENRNRWRVIDYYFIRVVGQMRILDKFDLISKVSELARVYGTQFIDVITRGSQKGIESMMLRLAKLQNMTPLSPTVMQRNKMRAPEAIPLVMEPQTDIYYDPISVLDFQSLYPSVVIAYNYCYSTCLGRVLDLESKGKFHFGCAHLSITEEELKYLLESNSIHVSPCGVAFVKKNIRRGILPKMLSELIVTRALVKDQMKKNMRSDRPNRRLQRILDHRQHGLKMMANTTYGYTGASYTGRMPCVEIADSIVSKGRETLERAIELVESRDEWGAKVVYGDTDSMFIQFKGCDRETAFKRSMEMVDAITASNPYPIKMKFEKIYQPCVLQTKKRYCGFKYESPEQRKPEFEVKGMEVIRRDCCPAAAKMLEMALRIQFTTRDINEVKKYCQNQFVKIKSGKLSNLQDFFFARKYKLREQDKADTFVPVWRIAQRLSAIDPRSEPREGERVPFVIIRGEAKDPLVKLARTPIEMLRNLSFRIDADYYIQNIVCPTLNRVFCTMNVDTLIWYKTMPHGNIIHRSHYLAAQKNLGGFQQHHQLQHQSTMSQFFSPSHCPICAKSILINDDICDDCRSDLSSSVVRLSEEISRYQRKMFAVYQLCRACSSLEGSQNFSNDQHYNPCISYDCPNLFRYHQAKLDSLSSNFLTQILKSLN